jgi:hypothetical protein
MDYTERPFTDANTQWAGDAWFTRYPSYPENARTGTFYLDNDTNSPYYGDVVRKSDWAAMNGPDAMAYTTTRSSSNTFNLYLQISPNHQFGWYYMQGSTFRNEIGLFRSGDINAEYGVNNYIRAWNFSYKAVLGTAGILDARYGRNQNYRDAPRAGKESVQVKGYRSYWAIGTPGRPSLQGSPNITDFSSFWSNGIIDNAWPENPGTFGLIYFNTLGLDSEGSNGSGVNSMNVNYQHMLEYKGSHIIDVGFNMEDADSPSIAPTGAGARLLAVPVGKISPNLQASQIAKMAPYQDHNGAWLFNNTGLRGPVSMYLQNPYIVFDVRNTLISQLEPHVLTRQDYQGRTLYDGPIWNSATNALSQQFQDSLSSGQLTSFNNSLPRMTERFGNETSEMTNTVTSYYINDMWTINENHSVMLGLRGDSLMLKDSVRTVHSYTKITPRFEYKYDIFGDQKHLFAASYAQLHQMAPMSLYLPFVATKLGNSQIRYWTGDAVDASKKQTGYYLVNQSDILNPENYGIILPPTYSGSQFGDVDKDFKPATTTEYAAWYRHTFQNGGYIKVGYSTRTWSDLYDYLPGEPFEPGGTALKRI